MKNLNPRAVWIFFFNSLTNWAIAAPILFFVGLVFLTVLSKFIFGLSRLSADIFLKFVFLIMFLGPVMIVFLSYIWAYLFYKSYKYGLVDKGVKMEKGVIYKHYAFVPYERIQNIDIYRGLLSRILGLSDLHIQTAGYSGFTLAETTIPGLDPETAEGLKEELISKVKSGTPGL